MRTELNSSEKIKCNMEIAMEWIDKLDCSINSVRVYESGVAIMVNENKTEFPSKILEIAKEEGVIFYAEYLGSSDFLSYSCDNIGLRIVFAN